ncbi:MAG: hypothetical protein Q7U28_05135 [Aquabacterium sp.]|nr:hypothetical protein [Aquabacterium sp.]
MKLNSLAVLPLRYSLLKHFVEEGHYGIVLDQPLAVLGEHRGHPHRVVHQLTRPPLMSLEVLR